MADMINADIIVTLSKIPLIFSSSFIIL